jgi:ATP phosphoribosyltransferase regulatory subunit
MLDETILKREEKAVFALRSLYRQYGYAPYKMSKFEDYEYYIRNKDFLVSDRIITFNDTNGRLLALKPDVTLSIIKNGEDTPGCKQKVCYNENVYRVSESTGQYKEILQAGLECIGDIDTYDIFETVSLAAQSLALIAPDFVLQVSHLGILSQALDRTCKDAAFQSQAVEYISQKNTHDLSRLCKEYGADDTRADHPYGLSNPQRSSWSAIWYSRYPSRQIIHAMRTVIHPNLAVCTMSHSP